MTRVRQMLIFLGMFTLILGASHIYMFERISSYLQLTDNQRLVLALLLGGFAVLTLIALPVSRLLPRAASVVLAWLVYPWMGIALLMFTTLLVTDAVWVTLALVVPQRLSAAYLLVQHGFGVVALGATGLLSALSFWNGLRPVTVKPVTIALRRLPRAFDGFRLVQITDLHVGSMIGQRRMRHIVDKVNALQPDLIVITGDLVDGSVEALGRHVAPIADLQAPQGVYFITGNHEYYSGVEQWCRHVASLGIPVLRNERVSIADRSGVAHFDLAGVDDWGSRSFPGGGPDLAGALAGRDTDRALIVLAHQPAAIDEAAAHGVDLQLSGHTHGGQIWPFTYLVALQQPYTSGLHRHRDTQTQIYVSAGTGFWGPPMRLGTVAEITHITLRCAV